MILCGQSYRPQLGKQFIYPIINGESRLGAQLLVTSSFLSAHSQTEPEAGKLDKEPKLENFEGRENDIHQDMSWKTKFLQTSASLGKAQVFKGRCLTWSLCLKKTITLV